MVEADAHLVRGRGRGRVGVRVRVRVSVRIRGRVLTKATRSAARRRDLLRR